MESLLGQPARFIHCNRYTTLTDELSRLSTESNTRFLVISSLTQIVVNLTTVSDIKGAIEKAMSSLGAVIRDLVRTQAEMRVFVGPCTPRTIKDFKEHASYALVIRRFNLVDYERLIFKSYSRGVYPNHSRSMTM